MSIPSTEVITWDANTYLGTGDTFETWRKKTNGLKPYIDAADSQTSAVKIFEKTGGLTLSAAAWTDLQTRAGGGQDGTIYDWTKFKRLGFHTGTTNFGTTLGSYMEISTAVLKLVTTNEVFTTMVPFYDEQGKSYAYIEIKYKDVNTFQVKYAGTISVTAAKPVIYFIYGIN